jgi:hypothetical protein
LNVSNNINKKKINANFLSAVATIYPKFIFVADLPMLPQQIFNVSASSQHAGISSAQHIASQSLQQTTTPSHILVITTISPTQ